METGGGAAELVATQDDNPLLNTSEMPIVVPEQLEREIEDALDQPGAGLPSAADGATDAEPSTKG